MKYKIGVIVGIIFMILGFGANDDMFDIGLFIFVISLHFLFLELDPEFSNWWGGHTLPWAKDMSDAEKKLSEINARRIIDDWKHNNRK